MDFPIIDLMDEQACYDKLVGWLHPDGLTCPRCRGTDTFYVHRRERAPILDYRCRECRCVFNAFTGTALQGTKRRPVALLLILRGFAQGVPTAQLARELGCDRLELLRFRHKLQDLAYHFRDPDPLGDADVEADEAYQNAGKKGEAHRDPADPPRRRANKRRGHGTYANDRPPVCGVVGRESGRVKLSVVANSDRATLERVVRRATEPTTHVHTDEWRGYDGLPAMHRPRSTVCHAAGEWARDDDGDGAREVHCNTLEGLWTGLRNFRGVHKKYLH